MTLLHLLRAGVELYRYFYIFVGNLVSRRSLSRTPEPGVMNEGESLENYDQAMQTKLCIVYSLALELIYRALPELPKAKDRIVDLACGPGHFTLCLSKYLGFRNIEGMDLSPGMVELARKNGALFQANAAVSFEMGDITDLSHLAPSSFTLSTFTNAAHHLADLAALRRVLDGMDRITHPDGLVMVMDLVRLKTKRLTESYVRIVGRTYHEEGFDVFYEDWKNSMYAAWSIDEFRSAIPTRSRRTWIHIVPSGLALTQVIVGLPIGRQELYVRDESLWANGSPPIPSSMMGEWLLAKTFFHAGRRFVTPPSVADVAKAAA